MFEIMSEEFRKLLGSGEEVVLSDAAAVFGSGGGKLVLTNKRLFFCGAKGLFNRELVIKREVALNDIANADFRKTSRLTDGADNSWLVVKPKDGGEWRCRFFITGWHPPEDFSAIREQSMGKVIFWVNSIRSELQKAAQAC